MTLTVANQPDRPAESFRVVSGPSFLCTGGFRARDARALLAHVQEHTGRRTAGFDYDIYDDPRR